MATPEEIQKTQAMVEASTDFGIWVVERMIAEALARKANMNLSEFQTVLKDYKKHMTKGQ